MQGKRILIGITGGIAAYKIAFLVRILKKSGAEVKCIMTPASSDFISPLVLSTLTENPVGTQFWDKKTGVWTNHVEYGLWADLFVLAPLTANSLSKMASGACDNLVLATYLSMKCPVMVAPAMDLDMYAHPATKRNLSQLEKDGVHIIPAESGQLASGLEGEGRMAEPETIASAIREFFEKGPSDKRLSGKNILITAGPTYEAIDPVRFIGNHSSGKMGYAIAERCLAEGAEVILVSGPTNLELVHPRLQVLHVSSAEEMMQMVKKQWDKCQIGIFSAAVADYRPRKAADQKIKKNEDEMAIELVKNPDILGWAGSVKKADQFLTGFALETNNVVDYATAKLKKKNLNMIVMNSLEDDGAGFAVDTNKISILDDHNNVTSFELKSKFAVATDIVEYLINYRS
ncbi:MAG: bifunctional phosphopantothenoylcysteine decarboxylase/phosphopantothenate--cysteine ligase CoaBC [Flavobacteriales bacterium]